ncbi:hypothetical protein NGRA_0367 [Nosema granulosis]|uniref:Uncharacterized protein n=1 Tax=Nosema granulosis TaxID=83296 RepID=A0A9P6L0L7_9MICR|nr:hypothetical protein NGRA_0367 [Nosema granulosis]
MNFLLFTFVFLELCVSTTIISLSRLFIKDYKAVMMVYLFSNIVNLGISSFTVKKKVYYDPHVSSICLCFTLSSILYFLSFYMEIPSVTFSNYYSLRVVIVSFISSYFLNKRYTPMQLTGKILIIFGVAVQLVNDKSQKVQPYILSSIGSGFFNAMAAVLFEAKVKNQIKNVFSYIFTYNLSYLPFNIITAFMEYNKYKYNFLFTHWIFYMLVTLNVVSAYMSLYLSMSCDSFERTIISNVVSLLSALFSDMIIFRKFDLLPFLGFSFIFIGIYLYVKNKHVEEVEKELECKLNNEILDSK